VHFAADNPLLMQAYATSYTEQEEFFTACHESCRKDVERGIGVSQRRFRILLIPVEFHKWQEVCSMWRCIICLHNMIIRDETSEEGTLLSQEYLEETNASMGLNLPEERKAGDIVVPDEFGGLIRAARVMGDRLLAN